MTSREVVALRMLGQGLIEPCGSPEEVVRKCICVQTQYSQSLPIAVAARTKAKPPSYFAKALDIGGPLRKTWTVRWTLHTVHQDDIQLFVGALKGRFHKRYVEGHVKHFKINPEDLFRRDDKVWHILRKSGPMTRVQLHESVPEFKGMPGAGWGWDVAGLAFEGRLYVCSHMGATTFVAVDPPSVMDEEEAQAALLRRYLAAFGPATVKDFQIWTGLYMLPVRRAFEALKEELEWVRVDGYEKPFAVLRTSSFPKSIGKAKLLAKFDPFVMSHTDRSHYLPKEHYAKVCRAAGQIEATILAGGELKATWRAERAGKRLTVRVEPFGTFPSSIVTLLGKEIQKVRVALGAESVSCEYM